MKKRASFALFVAVTSPMLLAADGPDPRSYETEWDITDKLSPEFKVEREVSKQQVVFSQRIQFAKLAESDVAVAEDANGEIFVPKGEQFYRALTQGPELWCTANMKMPEGDFQKDIVGRVYSQYCILDSNKDGIFDSFFKRARTIEALPTVRGKITPNPRPIKPLRLTAVEPSTIRTEYFLGIYLQKLVGKDGAKQPRLQRFASSEFGFFPMEEPFVAPGGIDQTFRVDGAEIVYSVDSEGLKVKSVKPFPVGPIKIIGTNCGMINGC